MIKALTLIAALITSMAAGTYLAMHSPFVIRIERVAPKTEDRVEEQSPFGPVPYVIVQPQHEGVTNNVAPTPVPKPRPKRKAAPKHVAANELKSKWVAPPQADPFSLEKLFNVR